MTIFGFKGEYMGVVETLGEVFYDYSLWGFIPLYRYFASQMGFGLRNTAHGYVTWIKEFRKKSFNSPASFKSMVGIHLDELTQHYPTRLARLTMLWLEKIGMYECERINMDEYKFELRVKPVYI